MKTLKHAVAMNWGRAISSYSRWTMAQAQFVHDGTAHVHGGPAIWAGWHATNVIVLAALPTLFPGRTWHTFVAPGLTGVVMASWLQSAGPFQPIVLEDTNLKTVVKQMTATLRSGHDLVIAVDSPYGPAGSIRSGALWLARRSGYPIIPGAFVARPGARLPRWDRQLVPLPGGSISAAFGAPLHVERHMSREGLALDTLRTALETTYERAWALLNSSAPQVLEA